EFYIPPCLRSLLIFLEPNSLTYEESLKGVEIFRDKIYRIKGTESGRSLVPIVAVGLKHMHRQWMHLLSKVMSTQLNIPFYEASAKLNWHVDDVFEDLVRQLRLKYPPHSVVQPDSVMKPYSVMKREKQHQGSCIIM
ncbi:hypothetical protein B0H11DRAFT_1768604, partial [Mycena galericulata]